jgi:hypothetical protein
MVFAFDVIARTLQELGSIQQTVTVADMLQIIAEEREDVLSKELHVFCSMTKPLQRHPGWNEPHIWPSRAVSRE